MPFRPGRTTSCFSSCLHLPPSTASHPPPSLGRKKPPTSTTTSLQGRRNLWQGPFTPTHYLPPAVLCHWEERKRRTATPRLHCLDWPPTLPLPPPARFCATTCHPLHSLSDTHLTTFTLPPPHLPLATTYYRLFTTFCLCTQARTTGTRHTGPPNSMSSYQITNSCHTMYLLYTTYTVYLLLFAPTTSPCRDLCNHLAGPALPLSCLCLPHLLLPFL